MAQRESRLVFVPAACRRPGRLPLRCAVCFHRAPKRLLLVEERAMDRSFGRTAFTLIELLLLLGMIAMAAAVSTVAIEKSREVSNRAGCMNNLKTLGLAAHHYHDTYKSLPPGSWGAMRNNAAAGVGGNALPQMGPGNGPLPQLLPFLNCQKLFDQLGKSILWDPQKASWDFWF